MAGEEPTAAGAAALNDAAVSASVAEADAARDATRNASETARSSEEEAATQSRHDDLEETQVGVERREETGEAEEDEDGGLILRVPQRPPAVAAKSELEDGKDNPRIQAIRRIPTLVCDGEDAFADHDVDSLTDSTAPPASPCDTHNRRAFRLSKQSVVEDDTHIAQHPPRPLCIVVDTTMGRRCSSGNNHDVTEHANRSEHHEIAKCSESETATSYSPAQHHRLTSRQWTEMEGRRRLLAAQLLGRTPIALSQSDGNLGRAKSLSSACLSTEGAPQALSAGSGSGTATPNGKAGKQLVRSHALCGDDDTRLRPPPEFTRSNPTVFSSLNKSLSRDSSATDYTDSSGVDLYTFITATLHKNPKDRSMLLDLEKQLSEFVEEKGRQSHRFPAMSSYNRMLVHRVAAFFGLDHNIDQSGQCIVVNKADTTRIPEQPFSSLIRGDVFTDVRKSLSRDAQSYEEIRDFPGGGRLHCARSPLEQLSRRARSFDVSAPQPLSDCCSSAHYVVGGAPLATPPAYAYVPAAVAPGIDAVDLVTDGQAPCNSDEAGGGSGGRRGGLPLRHSPATAAAPLAGDTRRQRQHGNGHLQKAGSFGGVPVFYRANSNGVRPSEELLLVARASNTGGGGSSPGGRRGGRYDRSSGTRHHHRRAADYFDHATGPHSENGICIEDSGVTATYTPPDPFYRNQDFVAGPQQPAAQQPPHAYVPAYQTIPPTPFSPARPPNFVYVDQYNGFYHSGYGAPAPTLFSPGSESAPTGAQPAAFYGGAPYILASPSAPLPVYHHHAAAPQFEPPPSDAAPAAGGSSSGETARPLSAAGAADPAKAPSLQQPQQQHLRYVIPPQPPQQETAPQPQPLMQQTTFYPVHFQQHCAVPFEQYCSGPALPPHEQQRFYYAAAAGNAPPLPYQQSLPYAPSPLQYPPPPLYCMPYVQSPLQYTSPTLTTTVYHPYQHYNGSVQHHHHHGTAPLSVDAGYGSMTQEETREAPESAGGVEG